MKNSKYILAGMSAFCLVLITATSIKSSFLMPLRTGVGFVLVPLQSGVNAIGTGLYNALEKFFLPAGGAGGEQKSPDASGSDGGREQPLAVGALRVRPSQRAVSA